MKKLTKVQAVERFKEVYGKGITRDKDKVMLSTLWNDFTDSLCKDGEISQKQYATWTHPRFCN